jgi:hypothetical protein
MFFDLLKLLLTDGSRGVAPCQPLDPSLTTRVADALLPQATGCHLVAENPGHPAFLPILDPTVDAAALSLRDKVAAAAGGRTPPSPHGVHVPEWPFRRWHLGQSETWRQRECRSSELERLAPGRHVARGRQRHAGAVPGGDKVSGYGSILLPWSGIHSKVRNRPAHDTVRQLMFLHCNPKLLEPNGPVGDDLGILESAMLATVTSDESGSSTRAVTQTASCTWPSTTIKTTTLASEKVTPTAAATTRRYEICVKFGTRVFWIGLCAVEML